MLISDSSRLLFVHVQKTGGSSIERWLREHLDEEPRTLPGRDRHAGLKPILRDEPGLAAYFVVGCVRNPWSRLYSWHRMLQRWLALVPAGEPLESVHHFRNNAFARRAAVEHRDFESFVMRAPEDFGRLRRPQVRYLSAPGRRADLVARQESLAEDLVPLATRFSLPPLEDQERLNTDEEHVDHRAAYTPAMRARVGAMFAPDIAEFGYEF